VIPIDLNVLIHAITGIVNPTEVLRNKLARNETVIRLLKQFNLSPDSPPADFGGVYAYTLVEYGVGKPQVVLELFRQPEIRQAFQTAWGEDSFSVLLKTGEQFLENAALGDELRSLNIDARQEFYQFATVFIAIAKRTRTPGDILTTQQLNSLHRRVAEVQDRLERLPTIEGIRTEMARLAAQSIPALPEASVSEQCRAFALAQQMRGWFETLDYRFEPYEQWQADGFEWILNIPVRRGRYDRILVRGIEGEAELRDVMALRQSVEAQQTDEGWLVTSRRISRAARDEVEKLENRHLDCYTFDELVDLDADFTGYVEWLEAEIKRRKIDTRYVPLGCTKEEIDPDTQQRLGVSRYDERDGWIDGYLDRWLDDPAKEHISILGEFGTGKTWVAFHYAWTALRRYQEAKERGVQRPRLPLVITLRDYAKALNVENVLAGFFFTQHNIRLNSEVFDQLNRMGKLLLIFDGFDEMAAKVDKQQMINNFWELAKVVVPGAKVILTCRTEHFPDAREGRALLNAQLQASTSNLTGETPQFEVLELEKFNDDQIRQVMSFQASAQTVEQVISNSQLLDLARRPVMTELILEALPDIEAGKPVDMSRVYLYAVRRKMERDIKAERTFTSLADKLYFLCELSWEMLSSDLMSLNYREFPDRIRRLFATAVQEEKDLDHWHYDMMGQTMLIRNSDGDYTPAHRSLLEFFIAYKFAAQLGVLAPDFLELAQLRTDIDTNAKSQEYRWSEYFQQRSEQINPLEKFVSEDLETLRENFGIAPLTKSVMSLLIPMVDCENTGENPLLGVILATRDMTDSDVGFVGGNAASILAETNRTAFEMRDLSRTVLLQANLINASLRNANFSGSILTNSKFKNCLSGIFSIAFTSDGQILATGDGNGSIRLWDVINGKELRILSEHSDLVWSIAFSKDNKLLASASNDKKLVIWNVETGQCLTINIEQSGGCYSVKFHPLNSSVISSCIDGTIRIWDSNSGVHIATLEGHTAVVRSICLDQSGSILVSGGSDGTVRVWSLESGQCIRIHTSDSRIIRQVIISPDGQTIAFDDYKSIFLQSINGNSLGILEGHDDWVYSMAFSQDGNFLASGSRDTKVKIWDVASRTCVATLEGHTNTVHAAAFSPTQLIVATGGFDSSLRLWDITSATPLKIFQGDMTWIRAVRFQVEASTIVSGDDNGDIKIWDMNQRRCTALMRGHTKAIYSICSSNDNELVISSGYDKTIRIWSLTNYQCQKVLQAESTVFSVALCADKSMFATGHHSSIIKLWNTASGECIRNFEGHTGWVKSVQFSPNEQLLASCSSDKTVRVWNVSNGNCLQVLNLYSDYLLSVAFHSSGKWLATGGYEGVVRILSLETAGCIGELQGHGSWIRCIAFQPNSDLLASAGNDATIRLWSMESGRCLMILHHTSIVESIAFSQDGSQLVSSGRDGAVRIWDVYSGECALVLRADQPYEGMNITEVKGLTEAEKMTLKALGAIDNQP
jgi:predicted NACHT family NTPase